MRQTYFIYELNSAFHTYYENIGSLFEVVLTRGNLSHKSSSILYNHVLFDVIMHDLIYYHYIVVMQICVSLCEGIIVNINI